MGQIVQVLGLGRHAMELLLHLVLPDILGSICGRRVGNLLGLSLLLVNELLIDELHEVAQLVLKQEVDGDMVLRDERRCHESVLRVLDQLAEVNHESPREGQD